MKTSSDLLALSIFLSAFCLSAFNYREVQCAAIDSTLTTHNPIVYTRYVRRRQPMEPGDQYVDEFVEVFHTQHKPPAVNNPMTDEDIDKFMFCDFHRETDECKLYWEATSHVGPMGRPFDSNPPTVKPSVTTSSSPSVKTTNRITSTSTTSSTGIGKHASTTVNSTSVRTSTASVTTSTTTTSSPTLSATSTIPPITTTTFRPVEVLPRIPDISFEEDNDIDNNFDDYDGATEYADVEDKKDQEDQNQTTNIFKSPFNFFG